jgi:hypothetical protein
MVTGEEYLSLSGAYSRVLLLGDLVVEIVVEG